MFLLAFYAAPISPANASLLPALIVAKVIARIDLNIPSIVI
jgi:hypothetical protein